MRDVFSSHVARIGYAPEASELWVEWQTGKRSVYIGVPPTVASSVMSSWSVGQALRRDVKPVYGHRYERDG